MTDLLTAEALDLRESTLVLEEGKSPIQDDGTVLMHVIRPGLGRGKGRHLYESAMLERNASKFTGWKMYVNHLSPEAKKAAGGLPRDVRDLGGRIVESWWDPNVPANDRFGKGAVVAKAKPTPFIRDLIQNDPEIVEASISATATGVRQGSHQGQGCWIVEGIEDRGSVDWVTEAGAGGRVVSIMEAAYEHDSEGRMALLASLTDDEFASYLADERPDLLTSITEAKKSTADAEDPEDAADGGDDEEEEQFKKLKAKGLSDKQARAMASKAAAKAAQESEEDEDMITPEALREALSSDEGITAIVEALNLEDVLEEALTQIVAARLPQLLEEALDTEREVFRATARADADRRVQVERFKATAHGLVEATRLPQEFKDDIKSRFDITEAGPTPALNVVDDIGSDGEVVKKAEDKLTEAIEAEVTRARKLAAAAYPTRVRGQGPSVVDDGTKVVEGTPSTPTGSPLVESLFREAGFEDPSKVLA